VTVAAVVAALTPYLAGMALARGLRDEAAAAVEQGADLTVGCEQFGRPAPVPLAAAEQLRAVPGVASVAPRILGRIELGAEHVEAVVLGVPAEGLPAALECVEGRLPRAGAGNELVVGSDMARRLHLRVGARLPPFYRNRQGERVSEVVGVFRSDVSLWQARLVVTSFETAARIFDQPGLATDLLVRCRPGYEDEVRVAVLRGAAPALAQGERRPRVLTREELAARLPEGLAHREGAFTALFVLALASAALVVLVTSGVGLAERRREAGVLKAIGWQTDELLLRALVESAVLSLAAAALSVVLAYVWLGPLNGYGLAAAFLRGVDLAPGFRVPFRLAPVPALLGLLLALVVVLSGSLYSTWRAAIAPPAEAMR